MSGDLQLAEDLVARVPEFEELYEAHVENEGGMVLSHVFFWDVTQATVDSFLDAQPGAPDWRSTLQFLEEQGRREVPEINEVIVTSFLNNLPFPGQPGHGIVEQLGPALAEKFAKIRPSG
ncbi:hypothetical protein ACFOZ0_22440 [Streptomyces yaanensis]|uniref:CdiI immunity protein domain-containing protein n=1 Tax=Streptomyces yaanensis TaxID=1142239 RepID=A0ABV7SG96_9ACTN|nr:hypothetical protein [Streptomyces sp. CGMCC 4.7035]WNB97416.1 hypothetical protein Q2K21_04650 [Streptomyces sp. CGMCC 4.7035]